ncbi:hypothetical protein EST38_g5434 [Candolleomyces aberdarensis]|uniref:Uncharacterized protein n=1 Tax=Candolleomyces aberdarensis TaxID=2316362 RepID=A0A4Q2DMA0_9AGAR|nr:hypothetical protein EST38_g5434 [Candolleomyces aberdarensis]
MLARRSSIKSQQSSSQQQQRHASPGISRQRVPHPLPLGPESHYQADPAVMTPHEQVLRARLERVLQSGKVVGSPKRDVYYEDWKREDSSPPADDEQESSSSEDVDEDENVVRDENGTRAWRRDTHPPVSSRRAPIVVASPSSSGSGSARSDSQERLQQRSRSSTEPNFPVMQQPASPYPPHPTPRRSTTAPNGATLKRQPQPQHHHRGRHAPSGTTPPLVSDGSPTPPEDDEEDRESDEMRLLTPPSTPPSHLATYNHQALAAAYGYAPSPYYTKTAFSATERRGRTLQGRGRPPLRGIGPAVYDEDEDDDEEDSVSGGSSYYEEGEGYYCSSGSCSSCSGSGCSSCVRYIHKQLPTNPMQHTLPPRHQLQQLQQQQQRQQQFNVRRASARCREMDGYISFAAVEGLGAPPESESGEEAASENAQKEAAAKKGGVGGWVRRLWGSEGGPGAVVV